MEKRIIRKEIIEKRRSLSASKVKDYSAAICNRIIQSDFYKDSKIVLAYMSTRNEVSLEAVIEKALIDEKPVYIPKVYPDRRMEFYLYDGELETGSFGIKEPERVDYERSLTAFLDRVDGTDDEGKALVLVPGVAFDRQGNRIGYGGGYYDTFLSDINRDMFSLLGVGYDFQILEKLEPEEYDIRLDGVVTDQLIKTP